MSEISIMLPIYISSEENKIMTDKNIYLAKSNAPQDIEWVIVESGSNYYENEADIYINEKDRTTPNIACNIGFKKCNGKYVIFLSNDITVCYNYVEKMKECFDKYSDCGIASLGNNEHGDIESNRIIESLYFAICMMRKEDAWFDNMYNRVFDDTDLIFRLYLQGKKFYKNLSGIVYHKPHATLGEYAGDKIEFERSKEYFKTKYSQYKDDKFFRELTQ